MIFWTIVLCSTLNLILEIIAYFQAPLTTPLLIGIIYWVCMTPLFALLRWRLQQAIRFLPCLIFITHAVLISTKAMKVSSILSSESDDSVHFLNLYASYFVCTLILGQSDVKIAAFIIFPVYMAADIVLAIANQRHRQLLI
jgi:hypothetical protein